MAVENKDERLTIRLSAKEKEDFAKIADQENKRVSVLLRNIIEEYIKTNKKD